MAILFVVDESVDVAALDVLRSNEHEAVRSIDVLEQGATDRKIVKWANECAAIVVDQNAKDFQRLIARRIDRKSDSEEGRHRAGRVSLPSSSIPPTRTNRRSLDPTGARGAYCVREQPDGRSMNVPMAAP